MGRTFFINATKTQCQRYRTYIERKFGYATSSMGSFSAHTGAKGPKISDLQFFGLGGKDFWGGKG